MARVEDKYANVMSAEVTTNGVTPDQVEIVTGISLSEGKGILVDQIDYYPGNGVLTDFVAGASGDYLNVAWSTRSLTAAADFDQGNNQIIHMEEITRLDFGAAAAGSLYRSPWVRQFFPPMIIAAPRLFFNCVAAAAISGANVRSRLYFRYISLSSQEYLELAESFVMVG